MQLEKLVDNLSVRVEPFATCELGDGWRLRLPGPPAVMVHFVLEGDVTVRGTGAGQRLGPGWLAIVPQGARHALEFGTVRDEQLIPEPPPRGVVPRIAAGDPIEARVACGLIQVGYGNAVGLFDHLHDVLAVDLSTVPAVGTVFALLLDEQMSGRPGASAMASALMSQCLVAMLRELCDGPTCALPWLAALDDERLGRAIDAMLANPAAPHTVESLADIAAMSRSSFAEQFTTAFGESPMRVLRSVRLDQAAALLRSGGELSVDEVADRVGFASRSHFSRAFKEVYGTSPARFRTG